MPKTGAKYSKTLWQKHTPNTPPKNRQKAQITQKSQNRVFGVFWGGWGGGLKYSPKGVPFEVFGQNDENRHFGLNPHGTPGLSLSSCWEDGRAGEDNLPNHDVLNRNN